MASANRHRRYTLADQFDREQPVQHFAYVEGAHPAMADDVLDVPTAHSRIVVRDVEKPTGVIARRVDRDVVGTAAVALHVAVDRRDVDKECPPDRAIASQQHIGAKLATVLWLKGLCTR